MARLNLVLLIVTVACALSVVSSNNQARKLFVALEAEQKHMRDLEIEWGQLQLEQSTWAAHIRVESLAREKLGMRRPAPDEIMTAEAAVSPGDSLGGYQPR